DRTNPGVLLLSTSPRILQMNHRARLLLKMFSEALGCGNDVGPEGMPLMLTEFCRDLLSELERHDKRDRAHFELCRVCHMVTPPLLIRGFAVPSGSTDRPARLILTVQTCSPPSNLLPD